MENMKINRLLMIMIAVFFFASLKAEAAGENTLDLLLKEDADIGKVQEDIMAINEGIQIQLYEEINLVHLVCPESLQVEKVVRDENMKGKIEASGELPKFEETDGLPDYDAVSNIVPEGEGIGTEDDVGHRLFELLAWHADEVTENGQSLKLARGKGVKIALIDSGVDKSHPVLLGKIDDVNGKSYVSGDDLIVDFNGHGTATAGIIAQIAPDAIITPYKVMRAKDGESLWTIAAILDAVNDGNDVINMSLGTYKCINHDGERILINAFKRAIRYARNSGVEVFASSGNKGIDLDQNYKTNQVVHLPGGVEGVNTVSAVWNRLGTSYSNYGSCVDFCAPGGELVFQNGLLDLTACVFVAYPEYIDNGLGSAGIPQGYAFSYGTSLSSAVATACFADVYSYGKEHYPYFQKDDAVHLLAASSRDLGDEGKDAYFGNGEVDICKAIYGIKPIYEGEVKENGPKSRIYHKDGLIAEYNVIAEYGDKYQVNVLLANEKPATIRKWKIALDCQDEIEQIWGGKVCKDGGYIIIENAGYNQDIKTGEKVGFGFIAKKASLEEALTLPDGIILVSRNEMVATKDYGIDYEALSRWENGLIAEVTITNHSNRPIYDWKIEFTYGAVIENVWRASIEDKDDDYYAIINDGSSQNILPGESVTFGFKAAGSGKEAIGNISLISTAR